MSKKCDLFVNKKVQVGNNVSKSKRRTKRVFLPNLQQISIFCNTLKMNIKMQLCTRAVRTIAKHGTLDEYLTSAKAKNLTSYGQKLRRVIKKSALQTTQMIVILTISLTSCAKYGALYKPYLNESSNQQQEQK